MDLLDACGQGHEQRVRALLKAGAAVNHASGDRGTALIQACKNGHELCALALIEAKAKVDMVASQGFTALIFAAANNHERCTRALLEAGATVDQVEEKGFTALMLACQNNHELCARALLEAGADVNKAKGNHGLTALVMSAASGHLECVRQLSSYNASRIPKLVQLTLQRGHALVAAWLEHSAGWSPLHHLEQLSAERARALLRAGACMNALCGEARDRRPTPLERAQTLGADVPVGAAAKLVLRAAKPWSPHNHDLFPASARAHAVALLHIGILLSRSFGTASQSLMDAWHYVVMPMAVMRDV